MKGQLLHLLHPCCAIPRPQELCEKAPALPADIRWHFIGHLQSNKVAALVKSVPNLAFVETVDSERLARKLNGAVEAQGRPPLNVLVQVNTSGEESKSGVEPGAPAVELSRFIVTECAHLRLRGLMTIGMPDYTSRPENFQCLQQARGACSRACGRASPLGGKSSLATCLVLSCLRSADERWRPQLVLMRRTWSSPWA